MSNDLPHSSSDGEEKPEQFDEEITEEPWQPPLLKPVEKSTLISCWRCGKEQPEGPARCRYCRARLREETELEKKVRKGVRGSDSPIVPMLSYFVGMLVLSVIFFAAMISYAQSGGDEDTLFDIQVGLSLVQSVLVLVAVFACRKRPMAFPNPTGSQQVATWILAVPVLALALGLNYLYFNFLIETFNLRGEEYFPGVEFFLVVLLVCVQPAIFEELFFRYLAIGALTHSMNVHTAIFVSSVMFAVAHIGNPLGIPFFIVLGVIFGYCRWWSGSICLPMILHFIHNLVVILREN